MRLDYDTTAGQVTEGSTFAQLTQYLHLAEECCYTIGHLRRANDDAHAQAFINAGQHLAKVREQVTIIATKYGHI